MQGLRSIDLECWSKPKEVSDVVIVGKARERRCCSRSSVPEPTFAERARTLMYLGRIGSLSTLSRKHLGFPFGSVMPYALDEHGRPCSRSSDVEVAYGSFSGDTARSHRRSKTTCPTTREEMATGTAKNLMPKLPRRHVAEDLVQQGSQLQARQRQPLVYHFDLLSVIILVHRAAVVEPSRLRENEGLPLKPLGTANPLLTHCKVVSGTTFERGKPTAQRTR